MIAFKTKKAALEYLSTIESLTPPISGAAYYYRKGVYMLRHGEYDRPDYMPRRYKDGWGIHCEQYYYRGTFNARKSCRVNEYEILTLREFCREIEE